MKWKWKIIWVIIAKLVFKHIVKEANRLLLDETYSGLDCATNEEIELANIIADILPKVASSSKDGLTLDEVTIGIFPELRDSEDIDSIPINNICQRE